MDLNEIKTYIKDVIEESTGASVDDDTMLFDEEILDSMSILFLISSIESQFDVELPPDEVVQSNYETVERIANYVSEKM
ncbi:MAG: phosphopantetheine-binding protein [Lachnospiraceae bacterium]|nr:phosphopantetheine-binding protein [Lachnospiraceae bacterium]